MNSSGIKEVNNLKLDGYKYAGGDFGSHKNYWTIFARGQGWDYRNRPKFKNYCVCGQELQRNCWVYNEKNNRMKVIGSECINKFIDKRRTCHLCNEEHKNRIVNRCNDCRIGLCDICDREISKTYKRCWDCKPD